MKVQSQRVTMNPRQRAKNQARRIRRDRAMKVAIVIRNRGRSIIVVLSSIKILRKMKNSHIILEKATRAVKVERATNLRNLGRKYLSKNSQWIKIKILNYLILNHLRFKYSSPILH